MQWPDQLEYSAAEAEMEDFCGCILNLFSGFKVCIIYSPKDHI